MTGTRVRATAKQRIADGHADACDSGLCGAGVDVDMTSQVGFMHARPFAGERAWEARDVEGWPSFTLIAFGCCGGCGPAAVARGVNPDAVRGQ